MKRIRGILAILALVASLSPACPAQVCGTYVTLRSAAGEGNPKGEQGILGPRQSTAAEDLKMNAITPDSLFDELVDVLSLDSGEKRLRGVIAMFRCVRGH
ncbi:MAG: hypothetical protein AB1758_04170 [Candidatus Eremiobacterota bacterium]